MTASALRGRDRVCAGARGLIGDKFVLVSPGASDRSFLRAEDRETESPPDIPDLIGKLVGGDLTSKGEKQTP